MAILLNLVKKSTVVASRLRWLRRGFPCAGLNGVTSGQPQRNIDGMQLVCSRSLPASWPGLVSEGIGSCTAA